MYVHIIFFFFLVHARYLSEGEIYFPISVLTNQKKLPYEVWIDFLINTTVGSLCDI